MLFLWKKLSMKRIEWRENWKGKREDKSSRQREREREKVRERERERKFAIPILMLIQWLKPLNFASSWNVKPPLTVLLSLTLSLSFCLSPSPLSQNFSLREREKGRENFSPNTNFSLSLLTSDVLMPTKPSLLWSWFQSSLSSLIPLSLSFSLPLSFLSPSPFLFHNLGRGKKEKISAVGTRREGEKKFTEREREAFSQRRGENY